MRKSLKVITPSPALAQDSIFFHFCMRKRKKTTRERGENKRKTRKKIRKREEKKTTAPPYDLALSAVVAHPVAARRFVVRLPDRRNRTLCTGTGLFRAALLYLILMILAFPRFSKLHRVGRSIKPIVYRTAEFRDISS